MGPFGAPFIPNGYTDLADLLIPHTRQYNPTSLCARIEMRLMDCAEAYGVNNIRLKCAELMYDMMECKERTFQLKRVNAIRAERMRQYRAGKLDKPFDEYPPLDSYLYM